MATHEQNETIEMLSGISGKLDVLIALAMKQNAGDAKPDKGTLAVYLRNFGLSYDSIALILESSSNSIQALLSQRRVRPKK